MFIYKIQQRLMQALHRSKPQVSNKKLNSSYALHALVSVLVLTSTLFCILLEGMKHEKNVELCRMKLKVPNVFFHWGIMPENKLDFVIFYPLTRSMIIPNLQQKPSSLSNCRQIEFGTF